MKMWDYRENAGCGTTQSRTGLVCLVELLFQCLKLNVLFFHFFQTLKSLLGVTWNQHA